MESSYQLSICCNTEQTVNILERKMLTRQCKWLPVSQFLWSSLRNCKFLYRCPVFVPSCEECSSVTAVRLWLPEGHSILNKASLQLFLRAHYYTGRSPQVMYLLQLLLQGRLNMKATRYVFRLPWLLGFCIVYWLIDPTVLWVIYCFRLEGCNLFGNILTWKT